MATRVTALATTVAQLKAGTRIIVMPSVRSPATVTSSEAEASRKPIAISPRLTIHKMVALSAPPGRGGDRATTG